MKKVGIIQSNYLPWKGYFDVINDVDLFILDDNVQYTRHDWRNRNKIKTPNGLKWLTIPVGSNSHKLICEIEIKSNFWAKKHWRQITQNYSKTPYFKEYKDFFEYVYLEAKWDTLSSLNQFLIKSIAQKFLGIETQFQDSRIYNVSGANVESLMDLLEQSEADLYVSGPSAQSYIDEQRFIDCGIELVYKDYSGYPEYPQRFPPFEHQVSILDVLFNCGPDAPYYIWGWREEKKSDLEIEINKS
ncbi:MAG: WbqC family protein [Marinirhabdus sp.]|nr:WbqC family protein [Marinirhabdus sp.]